MRDLNENADHGFSKLISGPSFKKIILFLYALNIFVRLYGIWFPRWAWDEPYYFFGGINITTFLSGLIHGEWRSDQIPEFFNVVGIVNKYVCFLPAILGIIFEKIFHFHTTLPVGAYFARFFLGFLPNILILVYIQKIIRVISKSNFLLLCNLILFLLPFRLIETSIYAVADSLVTFFAVASIYYLIRFMHSEDQKERSRYLKLNAVFVCLATSTKINVGVICGTVFIVVLLYDNYLRKNNFLFVLNYLKRYLLIFTILFIVLNLPYLFHLNNWLSSTMYHANGGYKFILKGHPLTYFFMIPSMGIGWGLTILSLAGIVYCFFITERKILFPVLMFMLLFYLFLSTTYGATHNWHIPMMPFLILFASLFIHFVYLQLTKYLPSSVSVCLIGLLLIVISILPVKNIYQFKTNITEAPETLQLLNEKLQSFPSGEVVMSRDEKIRSVSDLDSQGKNYIVFTNDWFAIESHPYPKFLLNYENFQKRTFDTDWLAIRKYVENNWKLYAVISPKHFTSWTNNTSVNAEYFVYQRK
jgi:hypothetical protein